MRDEGAGLATPLDQPGMDEPLQRLADRRAGAAIMRDQLMLEGDAVARPQFPERMRASMSERMRSCSVTRAGAPGFSDNE